MSITSANAIFMLGVSTLFPIPQQLQNFGVDDAWMTAVLKVGEVQMGVDGILSGGFVFTDIPQDITLKADSVSNAIFDQWQQAQIQAKDVYPALGTIQMPSLKLKWTMTNGFLTSYSLMADVKRVLQFRRFQITWGSAVPAPIV